MLAAKGLLHQPDRSRLHQRVSEVTSLLFNGLRPISSVWTMRSNYRQFATSHTLIVGYPPFLFFRCG